MRISRKYSSRPDLPARAFTLIELLIVVGIISILALIAVPNFLEAQIRSKVSRAKSDMRTITVAIEAYSVDNTSQYPAPDFPYWRLPHGFGSDTPGIDYRAYGMTTPIAYLTSIPTDPFPGTNDSIEDLQFSNPGYWYATKAFYAQIIPGVKEVEYPWKVSYTAEASTDPTQNNPKWDLLSHGPDRILKHIGLDDECDQPMKYQYDPTNGTVSVGNIVRVGP